MAERNMSSENDRVKIGIQIQYSSFLRRGANHLEALAVSQTAVTRARDRAPVSLKESAAKRVVASAVKLLTSHFWPLNS